MFGGVFRAKEGKLIAAILALIVIVIGIIVLVNTSESKKYREQAVMAEKYLKEGNYEQAVEAYMKAMSMKDSNQELLSIGLAEAYVGVNEYDKALEVLRSCYQKTSGIRIKEKIEVVTSAKTEYEYLQSISRADIYFSNKEYDKAITEYEKAKSIKSKEITSYQRIAEAYIEKEDYKQAKEEVEEGLALTQSEELNKTLEKVDTYLLKEQYNNMILEASEYIAQENYKDGVLKYKDAIALMPSSDEAYCGLAGAYIAQKYYQKAIKLLKDAVNYVTSEQMTDLLDQATSLQEEVEKRKQVLSELYGALNQLDINKIKDIINSTFYVKNITTNVPVYYSDLGEGDVSQGHGMIIYSQDTVYSGDIKLGMKNGEGIYFTLNNENTSEGYSYYVGEWNNDIPYGVGKSEEVRQVLDQDGNTYQSSIVTVGTFHSGYESGSMHKYFYKDGKETGNVAYTAVNGIPEPRNNENGQPVSVKEGEPYEIGLLYLEDKPTNQYYKVDPNTVWGIIPYINNNN
jgi:tetratricopeptide (TPR) repeat protein